jgi:hypothetical protein
MALTSLGVAGFDAAFDPLAFATNIGNAVGGYFGSYLAAELVPARGPDAAIGGRIGGAIGRFLASEMNGGGNPQEFTALSNMVAGNANQVLALTRRDPNMMNITGLTSLNARCFARRRLQTSAQRRRLRWNARQPRVAHRPYSRRVRLCAVKSACG